MVAHDDEVGSLNDGAHSILVAFVDEDILGSRNPFQEIGEDIRCHDMDISLGQAATEPGCQSRSGAYGIAVGASVTGDEDAAGIYEELMPESFLLGREKSSLTP